MSRLRRFLMATNGPVNLTRVHERAGANRRPSMQIRVGFEMVYDCPQPTPMILT